MKKKIASAAALIAIIFLVGCASTLGTIRHEYIMRGQILKASSDSVYLCIGTEDGAQVGQEFEVYKFEERMVDKSLENPSFEYVKVKTGKVKITETESHYANAKIISGTAQKNYIVELR